MRAIAGSLIPLLLLCVDRIHAACDPDKVFSLPIKNVTLSNDVAVRGIPISVGTPGQTLAFLPQWYDITPQVQCRMRTSTNPRRHRPLVDTWIYDYLDGQCLSDYPPAGCKTFRGGLFGHANSTSYEPAGDSQNNDVEYVDKAQRATDSFMLKENVTLDDYRIGIPRTDFRSDFERLNALGMGPRSYLLDTLFRQGFIDSKTFSMYWGRPGAADPAHREGNVVFGGYDQARIRGKNFTTPLSDKGDGCPSGMVVSISDMTLTFPNGSTSALAASSSRGKLSVCLMPDWPLAIELPWNPYYKSFEDLTGSKPTGQSYGPNYNGMIYDASDV